MVLGLLKNIPILNSFLGKPAASQESSGTEAAAKANEKAIAQEGLKPLFIVALPEGDFSELKAKLKEKFNGRDLHFEVDPELKKPKLYILKPNALAKRNLEIALDKAFIKDNYKSIELSGDANKLGESLLRTMNTEFITLEGAERKIEYTQKEAEKAKLRQSLESLSKMKAELASPAERLKAVGVNSCANGTCGHDHGKQLSNQLGQPSLVAIRENQDESQKREPVTDLKSLGKLIRKINIEGKQNWSNYRASVAQLGEALQVIKPRGDAEHRELEQKKELHGRFQREISVIQSMDSIEALEILKKQDNSSAPSPWFMQNFIAKYINNKIETAQSEDLSNLSSDTLAKLEKSDPISQEINRKLVKPLQVAGALDATDMQKAAQDKEKAAQKEKGKGNHTKASRLATDASKSARIASIAANDTRQVGGIALTGQFSFVDQKEFHENNQTYKNFPELPENWKAESNSPKTTTQETQTNHNPVSNTPQAIAQEPTETSTETINQHVEAVTNHQSEPVSLAEEENPDKENKTQL